MSMESCVVVSSFWPSRWTGSLSTWRRLILHGLSMDTPQGFRDMMAFVAENHLDLLSTRNAP